MAATRICSRCRRGDIAERVDYARMKTSRVKHDAAVAMLTCFVAAASIAGAVEMKPGPVPPAADQALAREIYKELVEINTTHAFGSTEAAKAIEKRLLAAGFSQDQIV